MVNVPNETEKSHDIISEDTEEVENDEEVTSDLEPLFILYDCETTGLSIYNDHITDITAKVIASPVPLSNGSFLCLVISQQLVCMDIYINEGAFAPPLLLLKNYYGIHESICPLIFINFMGMTTPPPLKFHYLKIHSEYHTCMDVCRHVWMYVCTHIYIYIL